MVPIEYDELLAGYPKGTWVAVSQAQNKVMASGSDAEKVIDEARANGEAAPLILRIPDESMMLFFCAERA